MEIARSVALFVLAGLLEIGGGYLVWQWWRASAAWYAGALGGLALFCYGIVPACQSADFGRTYAAYGGWFIVLSLLWGGLVDGRAPDRYDVLGAALCLCGAGVIMYAPR